MALNTTTTLITTLMQVRPKTTLKSLSKLSFFILFNNVIKFNRFINQTIITTSCRPAWDVVALDVQVAALGAFLLPRILDFNLVVVCAFQLHLGKILSGFSAPSKKIALVFIFCSAGPDPVSQAASPIAPCSAFFDWHSLG
jgi:hypothetical protein